MPIACFDLRIRAEVSPLRKDNRRLQQQVEIVKKAVGILSVRS